MNNMSQPLKGFNTVRVPCLECNVGFLMSSRRVDGNGNTYENWSHGLDSPCPINFTLDVMWASYLKRGYFLSSISWWGRLKPKDDGVITLFPLLDAFVEAYGATGTVCQYSVPEWAVVAGIRNCRGEWKCSGGDAARRIHGAVQWKGSGGLAWHAAF